MATGVNIASGAGPFTSTVNSLRTFNSNVGRRISTDPGSQGPGPPVSTDPGRGGDPSLIAETPAQTALLNEQAALDAQAAQDKANAAAETARGTANTRASEIRVATNAKEADAYRIAAGIAGENASLEEQATALEAFQKARTVRATIGSQRADVATSGFKEAGTNLSLLRDSISQGHITDALTRLNGSLATAGYRAQQNTANAESIAATGASDAEAAASAGASQASMILAQQYADAGVLATSTSANLAAQLADNPQLTNAGAGNIFAGAAAPTGGAASARVVPTPSDPFLEGTLVNPAYTGINPLAQTNNLPPPQTDAGSHTVYPGGGGSAVDTGSGDAAAAAIAGGAAPEDLTAL